jgi:hypothetical protein
MPRSIPDGRERRRGGGLLAAAVLALVLLAGWMVPRHLVGDGVDGRTVPVERRVAAAALETAEMVCLDNPATRLWTPRLRVTEVRRVPGSCRMMPDPADPGSDYQVTLKAHGPFGIAVRTLTATCAGAHVAC